jgi:hypothetical protein
MANKFAFNPLSGNFDLVSDTSGFVPYTGATTDVDLGANDLSLTGNLKVGNGTVAGTGVIALGNSTETGLGEPDFVAQTVTCTAVTQYTFTLTGDLTATFKLGELLKIFMSVSETFAIVTNSVFGGVSTVVTVGTAIGSYYYGPNVFAVRIWDGVSTVATNNNIALYGGKSGGRNSFSIGHNSYVYGKDSFSVHLADKDTNVAYFNSTGGYNPFVSATYYLGTTFLANTYSEVTGLNFVSITSNTITIQGDQTGVFKIQSGETMTSLVKISIGGVITYTQVNQVSFNGTNTLLGTAVNINNYGAGLVDPHIYIGDIGVGKETKGIGYYGNNYTATYPVGTRIKLNCAGTIFYQRIVSSTFVDGYTLLYFQNSNGWNPYYFYGPSNFFPYVITSFNIGQRGLTIGKNIQNSGTDALCFGTSITNQYNRVFAVSTNFFVVPQDDCIIISNAYGHAAADYFSKLGFNGMGTALPEARLHLMKTAEQLRIGYDASNYYKTSVGNTGVVTFDAVGAAAKFSFSDVVTPTASDGAALGTTALMWSDLFLASGGVVNFANGDVTITHAANQLTFGGATTNGYRFSDGPIAPAANDGIALGTTALSFADLFLASGGVVNFANGDVTITHAANQLTFAGATTNGYKFSDGPLSPVANDGVALGTTALSFADLFLATGGVINFANGNVTLTHSTGKLTLGAGDFELADAKNIIVGSTTGTKIGTATTQKIGFYNAAPVVQQIATTDLGTVLSNLGLRAAGTAYTITTSGATSLTGTIGLGGQVTMSDGINFALNATTGTKIGTATTQKLGFYNAAPVVQQAAATDLGVALSNLGLRAAGTAYPITTSGAASFTGTIGLGGQITVSDGINFALNTTTGTKIGTANTQKLGFWNATPVVQPANTVAIDTILVNLGLRATGGVALFDTDIKANVVGKGFYVKEGSNATMGIATLVAGTVTVATTKVTANSRIFLTRQTTAGTLGTSIDVTARVAGTSFTITSNGSVLDTSTVAWMIVEPA